MLLVHCISHSEKLIHAHASHSECHVLAGLLGHLHLPKPALEVHGGEIPGAH